MRPHMAEVVARMDELQEFFPGGQEPIKFLQTGKSQ